MNNDINDISDLMRKRPISSYDELCAERERLQALLKYQKALIQKDLQELRAEVQPVINVSNIVGKLLSREEGKDAVMTAGTNITIDLLSTTLLKKSNFFLRVLLPVLVKNFTSHYLPKAMPPQRQGPAANNRIHERTSPDAAPRTMMKETERLPDQETAIIADKTDIAQE